MHRLKQLREERKLKQEDIAKLLHVEIAAVSKYETGRVPLKDEYILILSNFFNVSTDYFLGLTDERMHNGLEGNDLRIGLSREDEGILADEDKDKIREFAQFIANKRKEGK